MADEERKGDARLSSGCLLRCGIDLAARAVDESEERRCKVAAAGACASTQPATLQVEPGTCFCPHGRGESGECGLKVKTRSAAEKQLPREHLRAESVGERVA